MESERSTFRLSFFLKRTQQNKAGKVPVIARITINKTIAEFSTKATILPSFWNIELGRATNEKTKKGKRFNPEIEDVNIVIDKIRTKVKHYYDYFMEQDGHTTADIVRRAVLGLNETNKTLLGFFKKHNDQYRRKIGVSTTELTYSRYVVTMERLATFIKEEYRVTDLPIKKIDLDFVERFEIYIRKKYNCGNNNAQKYLQRLRTIVYYAQSNGVVFSDPFINYKMHFDKVRRGYLTDDEISSLITKKFPTERLEHVRDLFVFSCFTGLAYIDVINLREHHICPSFDGKKWIRTERQKTGTKVDVPLFEIPEIILQKYEGRFKDGQVLPALSNQKLNAYLKEIADLCGITKNLTFHSARHTFATTVCLVKGVPIEAVSAMLGHTNITTTQIYAEVTNEMVRQNTDHLKDRLTGLINVYKIAASKAS